MSEKKSSYFEQLLNWELRMWRTDSRSVISSIFCGLAFIACMQIAERIDLVITGGTASPIGGFFGFPWFVIAAWFYGLNGVLLVATINPIVSAMTATHPIAPFFILMNWVIAFTAYFGTWAIKRKRQGLKFWEGWIIAWMIWITCGVTYAAVVYFALGFSIELAMTAAVLWLPAPILGYPIITWPLARGLLKAGIVATIPTTTK